MPKNIIKAVFLKILYSILINLSFKTILVEQSTSNFTPVAVTVNLGVSADSDLKAQKPMLGRVTETIESSVAMCMFWCIFKYLHLDGVVDKRIVLNR